MSAIELKAESPRAPSYFSAFFIEQLQQNEDRTGGVRTLYIDRDPETFGDIARHLQGMPSTLAGCSQILIIIEDTL